MLPRHARTHAALWILRMLVESHVLEHLEREYDWPSRELCLALGMNRRELRRMEREGENAGQTHALLAARLAALEARGVSDGAVERNVGWLAERLELRAPEVATLHFLTILEDCEALAAVVASIPVSARVARRVVAAALRLELPAIDWALRPKGTLQAARLVQHSGGRTRLNLKLADGVASVLTGDYRNGDALLARFFRPAPKPERRLQDFPHLSASTDIIVKLLHAARKRRVKGVNVLLYGPPGTGKTALGLALAQAAGVTLFEVAADDDEGLAAIGGARRLAAWALCQRMTARLPGAAVLFDEAEDAFPRVEVGAELRRETGGAKGWINGLLESNPRPTVWITNAVDQIDPSFLRRFDFTLEVGTPPLAVRKQIVENLLHRLPVTGAWVERCAADERVRSGHLARAARVARVVAVRGSEEAERTLDRVIEASLAVAGTAARRAATLTDPCAYDPDLVNASVPLAQIVRGLARTRRGSLCLHGPSGTGKTAFAAHLARELELPLHALRASDLLSKYVGGTEANLARAFRQAKQEGALLFLDEADSFLQDRTRAFRQWEVTQVNELLVQMEAFEGVFVCATNLMESLDPASLRRFAIKVELLPLRPHQRWRLFIATLHAHGAPAPTGAEAHRTQADLARLDGLTPGDFATVVRRCEALGESVNAERVAAGLAAEARGRGGGTGRIGFTRNC